MNQPNNAHTTRDNTPQNAVIYTSAKSASIITQFFVQKQMKNHRTKSKLEIKVFSEKAMPEIAQACTQKRKIRACMRSQTWPTALTAFLTNYVFVTANQ